MLKDRYGNALDTDSPAERDAYDAAMDSLLSAGPDMRERFQALCDAAPDFLQARVGLARARHIMGDAGDARAAMAEARTLAAERRLADMDASRMHALGLLIDGKAGEAYPALRAHAVAFPTDAIAVQTCTSVFGLIGFSGAPGREADLLAYTTALAPYYPDDDWWFQSQHAFSNCETGRIDIADRLIDRSLAGNRRNAHAAHVRSHVYYEAGDAAAGIAFLEGWLPDYDRRGRMHGHASWHLALWLLGAGDIDRMWELVDGNVAPGSATQALPINQLTDTAAILFRAALAGVDVPDERWRAVSDYAREKFPKPGVGFADVHAALAHAMAGAEDALETIVAAPAGPAADVVRDLAEGYRAIARRDWARATDCLTRGMADHARIGGSRAQRDLLEHTLLYALVQQGKADEARRTLALRRPVQAGKAPVVGL